jgi:CRISPR-associated protein Cas1
MSIQSLETLIVEDYGAYLGKHSERLRVTLKGETLIEAPLLYLRQVIVKSRGVSISSDAISACAERGIPLHVVNGVGMAGGATLYTAGLGGTVQTRRAQLLAYADARGPALARAFTAAKIANQAGLLRYVARNRNEEAAELRMQLTDAALQVEDHLDELARGEWATLDEARPALLSIEGRAAQCYWAALKRLIPFDLAWPGRRGRGANDPFNSALNYGYAILQRGVEQAIVLAGLDPFAGFVHTDRPGKPSLTLDLIEEFRQAVVDRTLLGLAGNRVALTTLDNGLLDDATRRTLAQKIVARIEESGERYEGNKHSLREIIQSQARHMATFVRADRPAYEGFVARW